MFLGGGSWRRHLTGQGHGFCWGEGKAQCQFTYPECPRPPLSERMTRTKYRICSPFQLRTPLHRFCRMAGLFRRPQDLFQIRGRSSEMDPLPASCHPSPFSTAAQHHHLLTPTGGEAGELIRGRFGCPNPNNHLPVLCSCVLHRTDYVWSTRTEYIHLMHERK